MMKTNLALLSVLLLVMSGMAMAQQPAPQQPGEPGAQPAPETDIERERDQDFDLDRDPDVAVAEPRRDEPLTRREAGHIRSDELVGSDLMDRAGENVASVNELLIDEDGQVAALLVDVGGVLGIGATQVALPWDAVEIRRLEDDGVFQGRYEVHTNMTRQELEDAPEFQDEQDEWF